MHFLSPVWLLGLLLVPVIWYVHRTGPILRRHPVASLEPWRDARLEAMQAGQRRRADPAWIRRAIVAALLSLALAGPTLPRGGERVTVWVDDSLSMLAEQSGRTRLEHGLDLVAAALGTAGVRDVETRVLGSPLRVGAGFGPSDRGSITSQAGRSEPQLGDPAQLDRSRSHWLLTDGADANVNAWLAAAPVARVFQVAETSRNVGIARLSARPQPSDAMALAIQVQLTNAGDRAESRRVVVTTDARVIGARDVSIESRSTVTIPFETRAPVRSVGARLSATDALPEDDTATVDTSALAPVTTVVDTACPAAVLRAIRAHPTLRAASGSDARLVVDCGGATTANPALPRIRVASGAPDAIDGSTLRSAPGFADRLPRVSIAPSLRSRGRIDAPGRADSVLLETGTVPLIVLRHGPPRVVETSLDFSAPEMASDDSLPLLVGLLVDVAMDDDLLSRSAAGGRGSLASQVVPLESLQARPGTAPSVQSRDSTLLLPLLLLAMALLMWDVGALGRRLARDVDRPAQSVP
jgi:Aerotolerance regulator N-terminal